MAQYRKKYAEHAYPGVSERGLRWLAKNGFKPTMRPVIGYARSWKRIDALTRPRVHRELLVGERPSGEIGMSMTLTIGDGPGRYYATLYREDGPSTVPMQFGRLMKLADNMLPAMFLGADLGALAKEVRKGTYNGDRKKDADDDDDDVRQQGQL